MSEKRFSREHEWVELDGDIAIIGITEYAVGELGDIIYVELPEIGTRVEAGEKLAVVESVKAASDVYAPVGGVVDEVNEELAEESALLNEDPEGSAWIAKVRISDPPSSKPDDQSRVRAYLKEAGH